MDNLPLLAAQRAVWIANTLASQRADYNVACVTTICGAVDVETFSKAAKLVAEETETLRLTFSESHGKLVQVVGAVPVRWSHFLGQPAKVGSSMRMADHEDTETVFG